MEARELLEPCRSLTTTQIARDLRNEATVQLSGLLSEIPGEVLEACGRAVKLASEEKAESGETKVGDDDGGGEGNGEKAGGKDTAKGSPMIDLSSLPAVPDDVLDLNLDESLTAVREYREIIVKQREARRALVYLLVKSRCEFGSDEAANAFYGAAGTIEKLRRRRVMLQDAMELEGLDMVEGEDVDEVAKDDEGEVAPLEWHPPPGMGRTEEERGLKRPRVSL